MLQLLESGRALYVLAGICLLGIFTRLITRRHYKRLLKESVNLALTKNRTMKELLQRAENTYRMNQGLRDSGAWLEHQLYELRIMGMTLPGWSGLSLQLTWLCLLAGGAAAFYSYWYHLDTSYIVMYGGGAILMAMLTMFFDGGAAVSRREQLIAALQDYLENVVCPRLARSLASDEDYGAGGTSQRKVSRMPMRGARLVRGGKEGAKRQEEQADRETDGAEAVGMGGKAALAADGSQGQTGKTGAARSVEAGKLRSGREPAGIRDVDYLRKSLEQIAASRERPGASGDSWLKDLGPEEAQLIGDILKQYLA